MMPSRPALVVIVAVVVAAAAILGLSTWKSGSSSSFSITTFDLSQNLPTGTATYNGQVDCGQNVTVLLTVPAVSNVYYNLTMNSSGGSANVWESIDSSHGFVVVTYGGLVQGQLGAVSGTITFVLQGCGPTPTVALGLWGEYQPRLAAY